MIQRNNDRLILMGYATVVLTSFLLGLFPTVSKPVISTVSPLFFSSIVGVAPFIIFTPVALMSSRRSRSKRQPQQTIPAGVRRRLYWIVLLSSFIGGVAGPIFYFFGLQSTTAADASLLANAEMVFTIIIASFAFHEKLNRLGLVSVILVSIGIVVVVTNLQFSSSVLDFTAPGHILILMSSLCWGTDNNLITYASERIDVVRFVVFRSSITGPLLLLLSYLAGTLPSNASEVGRILVIGLLVFGGAMYFNFLALKWLGAIRSTLIFPISSLFGLAAAYLLLHETIGIYQLLSVGIIFLGIYFMTRTESVRREYSYDLP